VDNFDEVASCDMENGAGGFTIRVVRSIRHSSEIIAREELVGLCIWRHSMVCWVVYEPGTR
jgi:hypothetical protein